MALAVTDALDGGISLDEGGTRADGGLTWYKKNNFYRLIHNQGNCKVRVILVKLLMQLMTLLKPANNFKFYSNPYSTNKFI